MIYKKVTKGDTTEGEEISLEEAVKITNTNCLQFETPLDEMNYHKEVLKQYRDKMVPLEKKKNDPISELLPYLADEDLHEIVESILNEKENEKYNGLDLEELLPYLSAKDIELLFFKALSSYNSKLDPVELAPYLFDSSLSKFIDEYLKGNYAEVDIDKIYPYLNSFDIKRLFDYYLSKKNNGEV